MSGLSMVTGASGHLGNTLVRALLAQGKKVRAGVRDLNNVEMFKGLDCEIVYAEMQDQQAMLQALEKVDVLYHVAAVFKHWAKDPDAEIIQPNLQGTEVVLQAAAQAKVKKIVYVSSVAAVGHSEQTLNETHWNSESSNAYYQSKILSERRAWQLAKQHKLWMVAVHPSTMIGPNTTRFTDSMQFISDIKNKRLGIDPNFFFNFVDVRDVAAGLIAAASKGRAGERYLLTNETSTSMQQIIAAANHTKPGYKVPPKPPKWLLAAIARCFELVAKISGKPADLIPSQVALFYGVRQEYDIAKARKELGYAPASPRQALLETFSYLDLMKS